MAPEVMLPLLSRTVGQPNRVSLSAYGKRKDGHAALFFVDEEESCEC